jgi:gamma-glutamylcyclotransferase (GGCT)/AIG2-like uncharacterized protein YtfP
MVPDHPLTQLLARVNCARRNTLQTAWDGERVLEDAFGCSQRLVVYGTLAPGASNEHVLAECTGTWSRGNVHGWIAVRDYPVFTHDPEGPAVAMQVLHSAQLPTRWEHIDEFEGSAYCRILVPVYERLRLITIANLYEARDPVAA